MTAALPASGGPALTLLYPLDADRSRPDIDPDLSEHTLLDLYSYPETSAGFLRANFVSTLDGAATGSDGRSGTINNAADLRVFRVLRALADVIVVGASTADIEKYADQRIRAELVVGRIARGQRPLPRIALLTRHARLPAGLVPSSGNFADVPDDERPLALMPSSAPVGEMRELLGDRNVIVLEGSAHAKMAGVRRELAARGLPRILCEGGPQVLAQLLAAREVDELCLTTVTKLVAGDAVRIASGPWTEQACELTMLLRSEDALIGRWAVKPMS